MKVLKVNEQTLVELDQIRTELKFITGKPKTDDQVIKELIDFWKHSQKHSRTASFSEAVTSKSYSAPMDTTDPRLAFLKDEDDNKK